MNEDIRERKIQEKIDQILGDCLIDDQDRSITFCELSGSDIFIDAIFDLLADAESDPQTESQARINDQRARQVLSAARIAMRNIARGELSAEYDYKQDIIDEVLSDEVSRYKVIPPAPRELPDNVLVFRNKFDG